VEALLKNNKEQFLELFTTVSHYRANLFSLNTWWDKVALVGKINSLNVPQSLLGNMLETKSEFAVLQDDLIENLLAENTQQCGVKNQTIAQTLIDIPIRNLFERTADVGFLATDTDIIQFLHDAQSGAEISENMTARLEQYAAKYTVYDDIMLFDCQGELRAQMAQGAPMAETDPVLSEVLTGNHEYLEICRYSPLRPAHPISSLFLAPVRDPETQEIIGILCMSFRLEGEMRSLFDDLDDDSGNILALLDEKGNTLVSSDDAVLPLGKTVNVAKENQILTIDRKEYIVTVAKTRGYQNYQGLGWHGCVLLPLTHMGSQPTSSYDAIDDVNQWQGFSSVLSNIQYRAKIVTEDLDLVVLNGRIAAARRDADEFIPILEEIRKIGRQMQSIFTDSVSQLMKTALTTHFNGMTFQAALAIDIMDRNLYERANDCRWWALTSHFQNTLSNNNATAADISVMGDILEYINSLYTVYTGIYLYDRSGKIVAVSDKSLSDQIGREAEKSSAWESAICMQNAQHFCVSAFESSDYYDSNPTYIYNAVIRKNDAAVGGIGLVFDSEPEFSQMLADVLWANESERFGLYIDRQGKVISVSGTERWKAGEHITLPAAVTNGANGTKGAGIYHLGDEAFLLAFAVSKGYREYKTTDGYENDVIAIIGEPNGRVAY